MDEERARAAAEVATHLRVRGITVTQDDGPADLADLLSAVQRFEAAVKGDPHFVLPRRLQDETIPAYIARIDEATAGL